MMKAPFPANEDERLKELYEFNILDSEDEAAFDDLTRLAGSICQTNISLISLLDQNRQWFKSKRGLEANETPRDVSFCGHAIMEDKILEVPDSLLDDRFHDNPLATEGPHVRFYAGAPLITKSGLKLGTLCVLDNVPRNLSEFQKEALTILARQVVILIEARLKEQKISEAKMKLEVIVNNIPIMLNTFDEKGEVDWVNDEWVKETGWTLDALKGVDVIEALIPDEAMKKPARSFLASEDLKWSKFYTKDKNGSRKFTSWLNLSLPDSKRLLIGQNITESKNLEEQAKLASIGKVASGVGHEINNPLAILIGYLRLIEGDLKKAEYASPMVFEMISKMHLASERITRIVKNLQSLSKTVTEQVIFDLRETIAQTLGLVSEIYSKQGIVLTYEVETPNALTVFGNKGRIEQVILNLISNAKDASEGKEKRLIHLKLTEASDTAVLEIQDNGSGIPAPIQDKIFDPFFTTKDVNKGTGIGLSIVSTILKDHSGKISFTTSPSEGSTFIIELPITKSGEKEPLKKIFPEAAALTRAPIKVLVVDDEADIREILTSTFASWGQKISTAANGHEALAMTLAGSFDLILTDMSMPIMDGSALIKAIRENRDLKQPRIILMSGARHDENPELMPVIRSIDGQISKPFRKEAILQKMIELFPADQK